MDDEGGEAAQGILLLDSVFSDNFAEHIGILSGLAASGSIDISHAPEDISNIKIQNHFLAIIGGLLEKIITTPLSTVHSDILTKCLDLLDQSYKTDCSLITPISGQLALLLIQDKYPESRNSICKILTTTEYEFNEEQVTELNKLVISSHSTPLLKLLISKEAISAQSLAYIINTTKALSDTNPSYGIHKSQLLLVVESLKDNSDLCKLLSPQLVDFFKVSQDKSLILPVTKLISDQGCFETYFNEIQTILKALADTLQINCLRAEIANQPNNPDLKAQLQKLLELHIKSGEKTDRLVLGDELQGEHQLYSLRGYLEAITTTYNSLIKLLENKVSISKELVDLYDQFLIDILRNEALANDSGLRKEYRILLECAYKCSSHMVLAKYDLSENLVSSLIKRVSTDLSISNSLIINYLLSSILDALAEQGKITETLIEPSIEILKKNANFPFIHTVTRVATAFKYLACSGIENNDLTDKLCQEALSKVDEVVTRLILSGLEAIVARSSKLSGGAISSLIKLTIDPEQSVAHRIKAIKLLEKSSKSLREEDISNLSGLLDGKQRFVLADIDSTKRLFSTSQDHDHNEYRHVESLQKSVFKGVTKEVSDFDLNRNAFNQKYNRNYYYQATDIRLIQNEIMRPFLGSFMIHEPIGDGMFYLP